MLKKLVVVLLAALLFLYLPGSPAFAQEDQPEEEPREEPFIVYSLGQQTLSLSAGMFIPLFLQEFPLFGGEITPNSKDDKMLKTRVAFSLQWGVHLSNNWMAGLEVGGILTKDINDTRYFMLPITAKGSYIIHFFPFEFPIFVGTGMNIMKYSDILNLTWIIKPGFSSIWKYNINWGFGLNVVYWWVPQFWPDDRDLGRMGNFLELTLTVQYTF